CVSAREHPSRPWAALLIPVAVLLGFLALVTAQHQRSLAVGTALARGETPPAPPVTFPTFEGGRVSLGDLRGHPIVMNFWAAWCVPCREEAPLLEGIWKAYREKGLVVLGVDTQDLSEPARGFITRFGITYPNVRDPVGNGSSRPRGPCSISAASSRPGWTTSSRPAASAGAISTITSGARRTSGWKCCGGRPARSRRGTSEGCSRTPPCPPAGASSSST